jgi:two-component system, chemotaxis family, protein-glutamate methylesterase/glutaminase
MSERNERIRVLVVDDSALMRKLIPSILSRDPNIEVVGTAMDGSFALKKIEELRPDVVTLDLEMPRMDGMETLSMIMRRAPMPVVILSTPPKEGASFTLKALALGAVDFIAKPHNAASGNLDSIAESLIEKIKIAKRAAGSKLPPANLPEPRTNVRKAVRPSTPARKIIAIGISTGGPNALEFLLSQLPADFTAAITIVQHMPEGFTEMFARRLDDCSSLFVQEARSGDMLLAGRVLVCPGNRHMTVRRMPRGDMVVLSDAPPVNGHRPSADVLFHSVAQEFGPQSIGLLMTGMGEDGAEGLGAIKASGGFTVAQSEDTCVVAGMPRAAINKGYAAKVIALDNIASFLVAQCGVDRAASAPVSDDKLEKNDTLEKSDKKTVSPLRG